MAVGAGSVLAKYVPWEDRESERGMIVVVDYGVGNLGSIVNMFKKVGAKAVASSDPAVIKDAEKFAEEDKVLKEKIDAKNSLENYVYTMRNTIEDKEKLADKISDSDKDAIKEALTEAQDWLNSNQEADKEDLEGKLKEL